MPTLGRFGTRTVLTLMVLDASTGEIDPARKCVETVESIDEIPDRLPDMLQQIGLAGPARRYGCSALLAPVVKVTGNYQTYAHMQENFDFDASGIIQKGDSVEETGEKLFEMVLRIANGEPKTTAEEIGGDELFCVGRRHGYHLPEEFRMPCG